MSPGPVRILGLDPGTRVTGYGCIDYDPLRPLTPTLVDAGVLRLDPDTPVANRLVELETELVNLLEELRPTRVAVETLYAHYDHPRTAVVMAHARGVMLLCAVRRGLPVVELPANRVKQSLTGHGHASKQAVGAAVQQLWNLPAPPAPPDVADALAIALCAGRALRTSLPAHTGLHSRRP